MVEGILRRLRGYQQKIIQPLHGRRIGWSTTLLLERGASVRLGPGSMIGGHGSVYVERGGAIELGGHTSIMHGPEIVIGPDARLSIGSSVYVGAYCNLRCAARITIGDGVRLAQFVSLVDSNYEFKRRDTAIGGSVPGFIAIGAGAWLGAQVVVLPNVTIGEGAVVGAASVVTRDVAPYAIVVGNPARVVGVRE
jgi:acetyltransferase-like isoleucine patch superfamily enzyme